VRPQRLFQLVVDGLPSQFPPLATLDTGTSREGIVTLLVTDIVGWHGVLRTLGDDGAATVADAYHRIVVDEVRANGGRELEVAADNVIAGFERPRDALCAAARLRDSLRTEPWFPGDRPAVCMAIHSGRSSGMATRHLGSVALRCIVLCDTAEPWQILVSHATESLLEGELLEVRLRDVGERTLPKLDRPVRVFEVLA
jgi:class 3 adenylate cyclase